MNERIKELERQATETVKCGLNGTSTTESFNRKKFAELIVKEMCDVFDKRAEPSTGFYDPHEPAELIRKHFGVEE